MITITSRLGSVLLATALAAPLAPFATGCGNGDDDDTAGSDAGSDTGVATGTTYEVGCDTTVSGVHSCVDYQFLTAAQQTTQESQCTAMGGTVFAMTDTSSSQGEACTEDNDVGSCEVATGTTIKQFTVYYDDDGYTQAEAAAACAAANGDFKD